MRRLALTFAAALPLMLGACGGDGGPTTPPTPTPTPPPSAAITVTGNGYLTLHPSLRGLPAAMEVPIRIRETAGGTATWQWAQYAVYAGGQELGRKRITQDQIRTAGFADIAARQDETYVLVYDISRTDFDDFSITLGFADKKDGRTFEVRTPLSSFDGVDISLVPLVRPPSGFRAD